MPVTTHGAGNAPLLERLAQHDRLRFVPREELEWLVAHGELLRMEPGEFFARTGDPRESHHMSLRPHSAPNAHASSSGPSQPPGRLRRPSGAPSTSR
jgi:hypothetical protein